MIETIKYRQTGLGITRKYVQTITHVLFKSIYN